ncbi:hypothetical protein PNEG_02097 [Pneumocystis murina B123]|uniref:Uncharacterized protein n=1 Tax=Pneumocystis murina (strain B123) TaxID=1069680 RepID=M7PGC9_PNEMU|nr:hypothetical protein PNEG_02097 [Pneumocystis murina B123]EMR09509.1 hypothetical protein PNEG_02097 [Pneumocystis murina B123]
MEKNIHIACLNGNQDLINTLLFDDPSCINSRDQDQRTPLHWACVGSHTDIVFWLLERPDIDINAKDESWTALHISASLGNEAIVTKLLSLERCNVSIKNRGGQTALHYAVSKNHIKITERILKKAPFLVNEKDNQHQIALHRASAIGSVALICLLLSKGSSINALDIGGNTPLHHAFEECHPDAVIELLKQGADTSQKNNDNKTPIEVCGDIDVKKKVLINCKHEGIKLLV